MQSLPKPFLKAGGSARFLPLARSQMPQFGSKDQGRPPKGLVTENPEISHCWGERASCYQISSIYLLTLHISLHQASLTFYPLVCNNSFNATSLPATNPSSAPPLKKIKCKSKGLLVGASDPFLVPVALLSGKALQSAVFCCHFSQTTSQTARHEGVNAVAALLGGSNSCKSSLSLLCSLVGCIQKEQP